MDGEELIIFTAEMRRKTCFHEAAHAIIHGLSPFCHIYSLAVAPEGTKEGEWEYRHRKGGVSTDMWGACAPSDLGIYMPWDYDNGCYAVNKSKVTAYYSQHSAADRAALRLGIRTYCCGLLAGPIADAILNCGDDDSIWLDDQDLGQRGSDLAKVDGLVKWLPYRNELGFLIHKTEEALREPRIWQMVTDLALALDRSGWMEDDEIHPYLPTPRENWPGIPYPRVPRSRR